MTDLYKEYLICKERGHTPSNFVLTAYPPIYTCKKCRTKYRCEPTLIEYDIPKEDNATK